MIFSLEEYFEREYSLERCYLLIKDAEIFSLRIFHYIRDETSIKYILMYTQDDSKF